MAVCAAGRREERTAAFSVGWTVAQTVARKEAQTAVQRAG